MVRLTKRWGLTLLTMAGLCLPSAMAVGQAAPSSAQAPAAAPGQHKSHSQRKKVEPVAEVPAAPPPPPTLEQMPPSPPQVTYQNGLLAINAQNSTLSQVLRAVQARTGASIEVPGAASERVVTQLGPGQPRDVLATLLNGSKFDYIILGVAGKPGAVQKVILTVRQNAPVTPVNTAQNGPPQPAEDDSQDESQVNYGEPEQPVQPPTPGRFRPGLPRHSFPSVQEQMQQQQQVEDNNNNPDQNGKTPEQLLQEMQQMQQQQQQLQQQLNPANRPQ